MSIDSVAPDERGKRRPGGGVARWALALLLSGSAAFCQEAGGTEKEYSERARELLKAPTLREKAWGWRLVAGLRLRGFEEALTAELRESAQWKDAISDWLEYSYIQTLLGTAIELESDVPPEVVAPYKERWRTEAVVLLARSKGGERALLEMLDDDMDDLHWLAVSNALLSRRSPKLFEMVLERVPVTHRLLVIRKGDPTGGIGDGHGDGASHEIPRRRFPDGFPAMHLYRLTSRPAGGEVLVADGPRKVYWYRNVVQPGDSIEWHEWAYRGERTNRLEYRLEYLARLGDRPLQEVKKMFRAETTLIWRSDAELAREIQARLDEQEAALRQFIANTKWRGATDAAVLRVRIQPKVMDGRSGQNRPLAQPGARELRVVFLK